MDGVKEASNNRDCTLEQVRVIVQDRREWRGLVIGTDAQTQDSGLASTCSFKGERGCSYISSIEITFPAKYFILISLSNLIAI